MVFEDNIWPYGQNIKIPPSVVINEQGEKVLSKAWAAANPVLDPNNEVITVEERRQFEAGELIAGGEDGASLVAPPKWYQKVDALEWAAMALILAGVSYYIYKNA